MQQNDRERTPILNLPEWHFSTPVVITDKGGYIPIRALCRRMGIDSSRQIQRLRADSFYAPYIEDLGVQTRGGIQETTCIHKRRLPSWLTTINSNKVRSDLKDHLDAFKEAVASEAERIFYGVVESVPILDGPARAVAPLGSSMGMDPLHAAHTAHALFLESRVSDLEVDVGDLKGAVWNQPPLLLGDPEDEPAAATFEVEVPLSDGSGRVRIRLAVLMAELVR